MANNEISVLLSRDEAILLYDWLASRFANGEVAKPHEHVVGVVCGNLWAELFGMEPLNDGIYEAQLGEAIDRMSGPT